MFKCDKCSKSFTRKDNLKWHQETACTGTDQKRTFPCDSCGKEFSQKAVLAKHKKKCNRRKTKVQLEAANANVEMKDVEDEDKENPVSFDDLSGEEMNEIETDLQDVYRENWDKIRSHSNQDDHIFRRFNLRITNFSNLALGEFIIKVLNKQTHAFKIRIAFRLILENIQADDDNDEPRYKYFYPSFNGNVLGEPITVTSLADLNRVFTTLDKEDLIEYATRKRPNTKYILVKVTNMVVYIDVMKKFPLIGKRVKLPAYLKNNKHMIHFDEYNDNLCFFRCLAWKLYGTEGGEELAKNVDIVIKKWLDYNHVQVDDFEKFKREFPGITLEQIPQIEEIFEINIDVYSIRPIEELKKPKEKNPRRTAR